MPKDTFLNLAKEKQKALIDAATKEFSRVSFEDASINQIIKEAKISRGSFYMYFDSKEELYFYILEDKRKWIENIFLEELKKQKGDLVETFITLYEKFIMKKKGDAFFCNVIRNTSFKHPKFLKPKFLEDNSGMLKTLYEEIDVSLFYDMNQESLKEIFRILQMETMYSLMLYFTENMEETMAIESHKMRMNLLKNGIYKRRTL